MKVYIRSSSEKPVLDNVHAEWAELEDGSGIMFTVYSEDGDVLFENLFNYQDVDSDAIYDSATELALLALGQTYNISDSARIEILGE